MQKRKDQLTFSAVTAVKVHLHPSSLYGQQAVEQRACVLEYVSVGEVAIAIANQHAPRALALDGDIPSWAF